MEKHDGGISLLESYRVVRNSNPNRNLGRMTVILLVTHLPIAAFVIANYCFQWGF